jgi:DNA-binding YbaB/EbfC family protein
MKNLANMLKQAQELQTRMSDVQKELEGMEVIGSSAAGMCEVTINGQGHAQKLKIDPSLISKDNNQVLEDVILAAFNDAKSKSDVLKREKMADLTGGVSLPAGFQLPF